MKKMFFIGILFLLFACSAEETGMKIKINAKNYEAEQIRIAWSDPESGFKFENIEFENGKGEVIISGVDEGTKLMMFSQDPRSIIEIGRGVIPGPGFSFYAEKGVITITFDGDKWPALTIKGGKLNNDMNRYWGEMGPLQAKDFEITRKKHSADGEDSTFDSEQSKVREEITNVKNRFIGANPNSMLSLDLLTEEFSRMELNRAEIMFNELSDDLKNSEKGVALAERIIVAKSMMPGNPAPMFSKKDKDGNTISLTDYRGKYLLIDFWGTWCMPCRASHPHLVDLYNKYSPMGLEFINIAQEGSVDNRQTWLNAIETDGLVWTQILNDEGKDECDVVSLYAIQGFPTKVLIDPQGVLVKVWLGDSEEVDQKLAEIFGE